jgi:hypothetical protein
MWASQRKKSFFNSHAWKRAWQRKTRSRTKIFLLKTDAKMPFKTAVILDEMGIFWASGPTQMRNHLPIL